MHIGHNRTPASVSLTRMRNLPLKEIEFSQAKII